MEEKDERETNADKSDLSTPILGVSSSKISLSPSQEK